MENEDMNKYKNTEITYEKAWKDGPDRHDKEELYESIVEDIRKMYEGKLSEVELHTATRNLIEFCRILLKVNKQSN
jgi:hypothetical protein